MVLCHLPLILHHHSIIKQWLRTAVTVAMLWPIVVESEHVWAQLQALGSGVELLLLVKVRILIILNSLAYV